jgi:Ca2+ transporting ATPase
MDESHLTGESGDVEKSPAGAQALYGGSKAVSGVGRWLVTAVGRSSQAGAIAEMIAAGSAPSGVYAAGPTGGAAGGMLREETLLQRKLASYAEGIFRLGLGAAGVATAAMAARFSWETFGVAGQPWAWDYLHSYLHFFITGVTILVSALPGTAF